MPLSCRLVTVTSHFQLTIIILYGVGGAKNILDFFLRQIPAIVAKTTEKL